MNQADLNADDVSAPPQTQPPSAPTEPEPTGLTVVWSQSLYRRGLCPGLSGYRQRTVSDDE